MNIETAIAELTRVAVEHVSESVFLYGRPHGFKRPTPYQSSSVWLLWKPFAVKPAEKIVTLTKGSFKSTREGESHDHLIEISRAAAMVLDLEDFVLEDAHVERIKRRINEQRSF